MEHRWPRSRLPMHNVTGLHQRLLAAVLILLLAAALRFTGLAYGQQPPHLAPTDTTLDSTHENAPFQPDEFLFVQRPLRMLLTRQFNPKFFHNPSFLINTNLAVYWLTGEHNRISWEGRTELGARRAVPFRLYMNGRTFSALGSILAVAATFATAYHLSNRFGAISAALIVATALPMVQHAHYTTTSSLAAGFAGVCIWASMMALRRFQWWMFALAGVCAGLAAGSRYNAAAVSIVVFVVGMVLLWQERTRLRLRWVALGYVLFPAVFVFTTPHIIFDTAFFWSEFVGITTQYIGSGDSIVNVPKYIGLWYELNYMALFGIGLPGTLLIFAGVWRGLRNTQTCMAVLAILAYLIPYTWVVLRTIRPLGADQMIVPVVPTFALFAGVGAAWLDSKLPQNRMMASVFIALLIGFQSIASLQAVWRFSVDDTRFVAQAWIHENIPEGTLLHLNGPYNVPIDYARYEWNQTYGGQDLPDIETLRANSVQYIIEADAWVHHMERAGFIPDDVMAQQRTALSYSDDGVAVVHHVERLALVGANHPMHSLTFWHNPAITVYCVTDAACAAFP
ncbi:MAG: phospholipid carrier-dependent glycosyltransferase [Chloroflexota bacterium]